MVTLSQTETMNGGNPCDPHSIFSNIEPQNDAIRFAVYSTSKIAELYPSATCKQLANYDDQAQKASEAFIGYRMVSVKR